MSKIIDFALAQVGAAYVYGATGKPCTPALRRAQMGQYPDFAPQITRYCPVLSGTQSTCAGCKYNGRLAFDCAQLTRRAAEAAGLSLPSGAKSQFFKGDWEAGGPIHELPLDHVAYLYRRSGNEVPHTGVYTGDGYVVDARGHASGVVRSLLHSYKWTDYKILRKQGATNIKVPDNKEVVTVDRILQVIKGEPLMRGKDVLDLQAALVHRGYNLGIKGPDGVYGWDTEAAVRAWQRAEGLPVTGIWTLEDQNALDNTLADENGPPVNDDAPPVDKMALLTELEGLNKRQAVIIAALRGVV